MPKSLIVIAKPSPNSHRGLRIELLDNDLDIAEAMQNSCLPPAGGQGRLVRGFAFCGF